MTLANKRKTGGIYEDAVSRYLESRNIVILDRNYRTRYSEIDIVAFDVDTVVFVEVKYRRNIKKGSPFEAVDVRKQSRIRNAALFFLRDNGYIIDKTKIRFDVIGVTDKNIEHIRNAF